ncbi:2-polyprenyl-6-methoxyphenol hydroxylase-like FAD-dependent oxidoreductase [Catenuloplanes nepalensis]|uniref:2-polyprenyl-6-methoxyphenol hydroxylase-like FAD-dependent oxidoreductase n=1 Tax=Catenuloplanes nepalensis TaxID=587533 RepID=A0ABT9MPJ8_9ACTN|nr:FAD-dependent monooxygenase [Catenuloplanes nepalensis]MDP9793332.1 2-polyprenyl-6-methoxyphenol hydroxylase-like FAD-dependent oxidoreductase [Catenuloplanes nepalensis]
MEPTQALIIGGGVAGAATALALHRAGVPSAVFEAHSAGGDDAGAFLTVMANGMAALDEIGAARAVVDASYPARTVALFDPDGDLVGERPIQGPARTLRRATLYRVLQEQVAARGIPIRHGRRLTGTTGGVRAHFADGSEAEGAFLVGADGIHSRVRRLIDPDAPRPRFTGRHVIYGYADGNPGGAPPDAYHMLNGRRAFFGFTAPGDGRTWWFARIPGEPGTGGTSPAEWRDLALTAFRDDATPAAAIITATGADVIGGDSYDIPTTPRWHDDHLVLAGDAAHAASPAAAQGASMALADAVALAAALTAHGDDHAAAFATYEARRRTETEETVAASAGLDARS